MKHLNRYIFAIFSIFAVLLSGCTAQIAPNTQENKVHTRILKPNFGGDWYYIGFRMSFSATPYMRMSLNRKLFSEGHLDFDEDEITRGREVELYFHSDLPGWDNLYWTYHDENYPVYPVITSFDENIWYASEPTFGGYYFSMMPTNFGTYNFGEWSTYVFSTTQNPDNMQLLKPGTRNDLTFTYHADFFHNVYFTYDVVKSEYK